MKRTKLLLSIALLIFATTPVRAGATERHSAPLVVIPKRASKLLEIQESNIARNYLPQGFGDISAPIDKKYTESSQYARQAANNDANPLKSEALYQKAIDLYPKDQSLYLRQVEVFQKNKQLKEAIAALNHGIAAVPEALELYEKRIELLMLVKDFPLALSNANALVVYQPSEKYYYLRAKVKQQMHDKAGESKDLVSAVNAAAREGEDAMDEADRYEELTGEKVRRPTVDATKSQPVLEAIANLVKDVAFFEPATVEKKLDVKLYEIPIKGKPNIHTGEFRLRPPNDDFNDISLNANDSSNVWAMSVDINTSHCFITEPQFERIFGQPLKKNDDPPEWATYELANKGINATYYTHGLKLLKQVVFSRKASSK